MDTMIDTGSISVNVRWAPQGGFFLWGTRHNGGICDAYDLRDWLFAWHAPSFYGTFIEVIEWMNLEGVLLPTLEALDYWAAPSTVMHQRLNYSRELEELMRLAPAVKEALTQGRFMPDFAKWKAGTLGWKLLLDEEAAALAASPAAELGWTSSFPPGSMQTGSCVKILSGWSAHFLCSPAANRPPICGWTRRIG